MTTDRRLTHPSGYAAGGGRYPKSLRALIQPAGRLEHAAREVAVVPLVHDLSEARDTHGEADQLLRVASEELREVEVTSAFTARDEHVMAEAAEGVDAGQEVLMVDAALGGQAAQRRLLEHDRLFAAHAGLLQELLARALEQIERQSGEASALSGDAEMRNI